MKRTFSALAVVVTLCFFALVPAFAATLYTNGPFDGTLSAWTINSGYSVANQFTLTQDSTITGADFAAWFYPGDTMTQVDWLILDNPVSVSHIFGSGTVAPVNDPIATGVFDYDTYTEMFSIPNLGLAAGTYWFELENAVSSYNGYVYWDINNGPSAAWESAYGDVTNALFPGTNSDAFNIYGSTSTVPEPTSLLLLGTGIGGLALAARRRKKT